MKKNINIASPAFFSFLGLIGMVLFFGCHSVANDKSGTAFVQADTISAPEIIKAGTFAVNSLDTLPSPTVFLLSQRPAPVKTDAGFYITMQNFNTEDGLALSSLLCAFKDNAGNLWFGTSGNGVSVYNGKSFTNYSSAHGLIHNFISTITQDRKGNMWFGTYGGASKYDGTTFQNFTTGQGLADNDVRKIFEDGKGNIWLATKNGVSRYKTEKKDSSKNLFTNFTADDGLIDGTVLDIMEDRNGYVWFGGAAGISRYNPTAEAKGQKAFKDFTKSFGLRDKIVNTITEDNDGIIWVGTDRFVSRYDPAKEGTAEKAYKHFTVADGLADNFVRSSMEDREGNLWFGTNGGVSEYRKADGSFLNFTTEQGLADNQVESITEDDSGSLWFGTYGGGISKYDSKSLIEYSTKQGLPGKAIYATTEDNKGNLWFAPLNGGIVEYQRPGLGKMGGTFVNYTTAQGFTANTAYTSVEDENGNLWFGTAYGLCKYDGTSFTTYTTAQGLPDDYINALSTDKEGNLWIGTFNGGVSKFNGKSFTNFSTAQGLVHETVWSIFEDKDGIIWIATRGGLSRYDGKEFMNFTTAQGLPDNKLSTVMQDSKGNILTAGWGGGVSIIRKNDVKELASPNAGQINKNIFEHFSTSEGLANDVVYNILEDQAGNIIIGTSYGFTILKGGISKEGDDITKTIIKNFNEQTGYPIKDISNNYSMYEGSRGFIWAGTGDKLVRFDYSSVHKSKKAPSVFIQNIKINNKPISWHSLLRARLNPNIAVQKQNNTPSYVSDELLTFGKKLTPSQRDTMINTFDDLRFESVTPFNNIPGNLVLPYDKNNISLDFVGVETTRPHLVRYRYKLEGYDKSWSPVSDKTTASFGNIYEGSYTFLLKARSPDGMWSKPVMYRFKVSPPWYRSWFAYLFYSLLFITAIWFVYRVQKGHTIRNEREKAQQRELEQARELEKTYRELEIEAAMERVRSTSMAMRHTSDLQAVVNMVAQQLQNINLDINGGVFIIINNEIDNSEDSSIWGSGGAADYAQKAVIPFLDKPIFTRLLDAIRNREDFLVEEYKREEKIEFFEHLFKYPPWNATPPDRKKQLLSLPGGYTRSLTISPHTSIFIINNTGKVFSEEDNDILKRFGMVFEQSYIRFLDLQKAEAQAQETRKQAALDRVRGEISGMRSAEDLQHIAQIIFNELTTLGVPFTRCGVFIINEEDRNVQVYLSAPDGHSLGVLNFSHQSNELVDKVVTSWRQEMVYKTHWDRNDFIRWTKLMLETGQISNKKTYQGADSPPESLDLHFIPFEQGMLYVGSSELLNQHQLDLAQSLADALAVAYARYDDFRQLEQAKEKGEAALKDLQATQHQLVQQEKLASLGQLTAGIAHEIKNPLNFVKNFSEVSMELIEEVREELKRETANVRRQKESSLEGGKIPKNRDGGDDRGLVLEILSGIETNLHKIHEHGARADGIVKSMLQHSRGGSGTVEPTNLNVLIKEFVNLAFHGMRAGKNPINVDIEMDLDEKVGEIPLKAQDFSRVIINLCHNAFDAMREKTNMKGEKADGYLPKLTVKTARKDGEVIVEIEDNGPGIPKELRDKIMQPFFTTKKGKDGTGLGLYITNDIVKSHGGKMEIETQFGSFTRFIIKIPI